MTTPNMNRQIHLIRRPLAAPSALDFRLVEAPLAPLAAGDVRVRHRALSLDPYMRGRMSDAPSYAPSQPLDTVMIGGTVGEIVASENPDWAPGELVVGMGGWQDYQHVPADQLDLLTKVTTAHLPLTAYLGAVGMPGITAWVGVTQILAVEAGQTILINSAAGAVGSLAGQLVKRRGGIALGIAGGPEKCRYVVESLGFDHCLDYHAYADAAALEAAIRALCPAGIDGSFENTGGWIMAASLPCLKTFGRVALCGLIAGYNGADIPLPRPQLILNNRLRLEGFIVTDHKPLWRKALRELGLLAASGQLILRETVVSGLENAPQAFCDFLAGTQPGKWLVTL